MGAGGGGGGGENRVTNCMVLCTESRNKKWNHRNFLKFQFLSFYLGGDVMRNWARLDGHGSPFRPRFYDFGNKKRHSKLRKGL